MKVFLCTPHLTGEARYGKFKEVGSFLPPLGICYLGSMLEKNGHEVRIIDGQLGENTTSLILEVIKEFAPDIIGISSVLLSHKQTNQLARKIKAENPDIPLVLGGPHVYSLKEEVMKEQSIDIAVYGEGEYTILDLVDYCKKDKELKDIEGIIFREDDKVVVNRPRPFIHNLDEIPFPARHLLQDLKRYSNHILAHRREPMTSMITSRGCTGQCTFCDRVFGNEYRFFSADYVLREIDELMDFTDNQIKEIEIEDDTFIVNRDRVVKICEGLIQRNYDLIWSCATRVSHLDLDLLKLMKKAGCWMIQIGIETGDKEVLKSIKKGISLERVKKVVNWSNEAGVEVKGFFMIGHHTDTAESIEKTIKFARSLKIHTANFAIGNPYPGTEYFELAQKHGTFNYDPDRYSAHKDSLIFVPSGLTANQLINYKKKAYRSFYTDPYRLFKFLCELRGWTDIKRFYKGFKLFLKM
jgi:radical SAM superfamily enzyme YgiQ (UPF0313 family)